jgi:hypothetical protein
MKRIVLMIIFIGIIISGGFVLTKFLSNKKIVLKNDQVSKTNEINYNDHQLSILTDYLIQTSLLLDQIEISLPIDINKKIEEIYSKITKNISEDKNKSLAEYGKEIEKVNKEFEKKLKLNKSNEINGQILIDLAYKFSSIKPPPNFYKIHLNLIKFYLSIGIALGELKKTENEAQKFILYNTISKMINNITKQLSIKQ